MFNTLFANIKTKNRRGYSLVESLMSLVCVMFLLVTIVAVTNYLRAASFAVKAKAVMETQIISIAETISHDLEDGVDIADVDYSSDERLQNKSLHTEISVVWTEDVLDETLYWVEVDCYHKGTNTTQVSSFFLRGGDN